MIQCYEAVAYTDLLKTEEKDFKENYDFKEMHKI